LDRIDANTYDKKAEEIRGHEQRVRHKIAECQSAELVPAAEAVDLIALTSEAAELFQRQCASEQRRLLRLVMRDAIWQDGSCGRASGSRLRNCNYRTPQP
jgi:hypothetical protein